jgi:hypothetical protein
MDGACLARGTSAALGQRAQLHLPQIGTNAGIQAPWHPGQPKEAMSVSSLGRRGEGGRDKRSSSVAAPAVHPLCCSMQQVPLCFHPSCSRPWPSHLGAVACAMGHSWAFDTCLYQHTEWPVFVQSMRHVDRVSTVERLLC